MFKLDLEKEPEIKLSTIVDHPKIKNSRKTSIPALLSTPKPLILWITTNCGKFFKICEYQTTLPASWETCMQVKKQQMEPDTEQQTGSKLGKEYYIKAVYCYHAHLTYMQSTSCRMLGWMKHKLELREKYQQPQVRRWHHPYGRKWRRTQQPFDEGKRGEWKSCLKKNSTSKKQRSWHPVPSLHGK